MTPNSAYGADGGPNVFLAAAHWIQAVLLGPVATAIAVIAVAFIGVGMLSGRIDIRRGATVILGCFILFGAASIANGLRGVVGSAGSASDTRRLAAPPEPPTNLSIPSSAPSSMEPADPYAGAAVRR